MNKQKKSIFILSFVLLLFVFVSLVLFVGNNNDNIINKEEYYKSDLLKTSDTDLDYDIYIDDSATGVGAHNWTWAVGQAWCSGSGIYADPYVINAVNIIINQTGTGYDACLNITNSNVYFTITSCTFKNNATGEGIGIYLYNTNNSLISGCNCSENGLYGIQTVSCFNMTFTSDVCNTNTQGINNNDLVSSTIDGTSYFNSNAQYGIYMVNSTSNNFGGTLYTDSNTLDGIRAHDSDSNTFDVISRLNSQHGLVLIDSDSCSIINGAFRNNTGSGVVFIEDDGDTESNNVYGNTFYDNTGDNGVDNCSTANTWDNNSNSGNTWDDYSGVDADDDGIGDTAYTIGGTSGATDRYPIYDDGDSISPVITIIKPVDDSKYTEPPYYQISFSDAIGVVSVYYSFDNGLTNYSVPLTTTGYITEQSWDLLDIEGNEQKYILTFYAADAAGNVGSDSVRIYNEIKEEEDTDTFYLNSTVLFVVLGTTIVLFTLRRFQVLKLK